MRNLDIFWRRKLTYANIVFKRPGYNANYLCRYLNWEFHLCRSAHLFEATSSLWLYLCNGEFNYQWAGKGCSSTSCAWVTELENELKRCNQVCLFLPYRGKETVLFTVRFYLRNFRSGVGFLNVYKNVFFIGKGSQEFISICVL